MKKENQTTTSHWAITVPCLPLLEQKILPKLYRCNAYVAQNQVYIIERIYICFDLELPHKFLITAVKQKSLARNPQQQ